MWPGYGDHMGWMGLWWILALGVLVAFVWVVARAASSSAGTRETDSPEAILKRRYARGELNDQDFDRQLNNLRK